MARRRPATGFRMRNIPCGRRPSVAPPTTPPPIGSWPTPTGQSPVDGTIEVGGTFDGEMRRYCCVGDGSQEEDQDPMFRLAAGATPRNVIIGAPSAGCVILHIE